MNSQKTKLTVFALGCGFLLTTFLHSFDFFWLEARLYDLRMRYKSDRHFDEHVAIIKIDDPSVEFLREPTPLSMRSHVLLLKALAEYKPKAIAYFVNFNESIAVEGSMRFPNLQNEFVELSHALEKTGTRVFLGTDIDVAGEVVPTYPLSKLQHGVSIIHKDGTTFSEDKVTRQALFSIGDNPSLHVQLASLLNDGKTNPQDYLGTYITPEADAHYFLINYTGATQDGKHHFPEFSVLDILEKKVKQEELKDKIILIGTKINEDSNDYVFTPYSKKLFENAKLTVHANILETLIHNKLIRESPAYFNFVLTLLFTFLVISTVLLTPPARSLAITLASLGFLSFTAIVCFQFFSVWIYLSHPLAGIIISYYLFLPYRLIREYKERWNYQKRHEVLMQVEELKTNFTRLITHDLKTPVARIQGMAEILKSKGADDSLVSEILSSTEELNLFVTSILELTKVESKGIELNKVSKDINRLIEEVIRKLQFPAKNKKITIQTKLEPLFPILIDAVLLSKVFSNIIDNAIRYSPDGAVITIESRESLDPLGFVEILIKDTGYGISKKDLEHLFSKFYRSKNDMTMKTKGTGLGLFLSRYFVELHQGSLTVISEVGAGSTFRILLPNDESTTVQPRKNTSQLNTNNEEIPYV